MGKLGLEKVSKRSRRDPDHEKTFLTFTLSVNKIILYQFSMFKSLGSIASVVGMFMYLTISKLKQVLRSWKGLGKVSTTTLIYTWLLEPDQISHTQSMVTEERPHKSGKRSYMWTKKIAFKTVRQNSNRSSNFGCNWTSFHSLTK